MSDVQLSGVCKTYPNGVRAVHDATFDVYAGRRLVIVGPSGSGKSTILRLIAGLEPLSAGEISLSKQRIDHLSPR